MQNFFAPGRINLIGEHIDYNGGFVLPAAISLGTSLQIVSLSPIADEYCIFSSVGKDVDTIDIAQPLVYDKKDDWANYVKAVIWTLQQKNIDLPLGLILNYSTNLPLSSGLSSSACIEVLTAFALREMAGCPTDRTTLALEMQFAENEFMGVPCGIMDQFAIANGKKDHAILLDCSTLKYEYVPIQLQDYQLVILNSNQPRKLVESKYHERKAECEAALAILQVHKPDLQNLCSASEADLVFLEKTPILQQRARHCITEQQRVLESVKALSDNNFLHFGQLLNASHASLCHDYDVTGSVLDALVAAAQVAEGCIGARMTGAGFGGCAIALVKKSDFSAFSKNVKKVYKSQTKLETTIYKAEIMDGVKSID
jgi:galactokinase